MNDDKPFESYGFQIGWTLWLFYLLQFVLNRFTIVKNGFLSLGLIVEIGSIYTLLMAILLFAAYSGKSFLSVFHFLIWLIGVHIVGFAGQVLIKVVVPFLGSLGGSSILLPETTKVVRGTHPDAIFLVLGPLLIYGIMRVGAKLATFSEKFLERYNQSKYGDDYLFILILASDASKFIAILLVSLFVIAVAILIVMALFF